MRHVHLKGILFMLAFTAGICMGVNQAGAATAHEIDLKARMTLDNLYAKSPAAKALGDKAVGILVFPSVVKGGFIVGGQYGEGALLKKGKTAGYYNTVQLSYGLQAGAQKYGYVLFFMSDSAMSWLYKSDGWELGVGPTIVVLLIRRQMNIFPRRHLRDLPSKVLKLHFKPHGECPGVPSWNYCH